MVRRRTRKRVVSLACVLCMLISLIGGGTIASAADEEPAPEDGVTAAQAALPEEEAGLPTNEAWEDDPAASPGGGEEPIPAAEAGTDETPGMDAAEGSEEPSAPAESDGDDAAPPAGEAEPDPPPAEAEALPSPAPELPEETPAPALYAGAIEDSISHNGVTVSVSAPAGSFPEGTAPRMLALEAEYCQALKEQELLSFDSAQAFDIAFLSPDSESLQPLENTQVEVTFRVSGESALAAAPGETARLEIYHIGSDALPERVKAAPAMPAGQDTIIKFDASGFSVYLIAKITETLPAESGETSAHPADEPETEIAALPPEAPENTREESPWSLGLVFYDSTVNGGLTPLDSIDWDASNGGYQAGEARVITLQINYKNTNVDRDYAPGELEISIPNLTYGTTSAAHNTALPNWTVDRIIVGANDSTHTGYDWNFTTGSAPTVGQGTYTFTNAETLTAGSNFEGSIQIVYQITPRGESPEVGEDSCVHSYSWNGQAVLKAEDLAEPLISNEAGFDYTRTYTHPWTRYEYRLDKTAGQVANPAELTEDYEDYVWVKYTFTYDNYTLSAAYPIVYAQDIYVADAFPEGCLVLDKDGEEITPEDGVYKITKTEFSGTYSSNPPVYRNIRNVCYVGYPKAEYNQENGNLNLHNDAELWGKYPDRETPESLAEGEVDLNLNDYIFHYPPGYYDINKRNQSAQMRYQNILAGTGAYVTTWGIQPIARYSGSAMDVEFGDDVLYYLNDQNEYARLSDEDYYITAISLSTVGASSYNPINNGWATENGSDIERGKYDVELWLRYAGSSDFVKYETFKNREKGNWAFSKNSGVVGFYFVVKDMKESLWPMNGTFCTCTMAFRAQDIAKAGSLYNFDYIKAYLDDGTGSKYFANQPGEGSYASFLSKLDIAAFDQEQYGEYRQRASAYNTWSYYDPRVTYFNSVNKSTSSLTQNEAEECFTGSFTLFTNVQPQTFLDLSVTDYYHTEDMIRFIGIYDLLPRGVELTATAEELLANAAAVMPTSSYAKYFDASMQELSAAEVKAAIEERMTVTVTPDWNGTGRTHIALRADLQDAPFYFFRANSSSYYISLRLSPVPYRITYDSYLEYGSTYTNYDYSEVLYADGRRTNNLFDTADRGVRDAQAADINENGLTSDYLSISSASVTITSVISTHQSLEKTVMTPSSGQYVSGEAAGDVDGEYSYRLRVRTGRASVTGLVVYDSLERYIQVNGAFSATPGGEISWTGALLGVDTSHPESKGYTVRVWYSPSEQPGALGEDSSWQLYSGETDNSGVRSLAFEYLDADGQPAVLPPNSVSYLYIRMKAPDHSYETRLAYNGAWSTWTPLDEFGVPTDFITGINSNIVRVSLREETQIEVKKEWVGDTEDQRPESISVQLLQNGTAWGDPVELSAENGWACTFEDLPKCDDDGKEYTYSVKELTVEGYTGKVTAESGAITLINVPSTSVKAAKQWVGPPAESATIRLLADGAVVETVELNAENNWQHTFDGLPKYDFTDGHEIAYDVQEDPMEGYEPGRSGSVETGFTFTNTISGRVSIPVTKRWVGPAADSVTVVLLADRVEIAEAVLSGENNWQHTFADLPKYKDGVEIQYEIREPELEGYAAAMTVGEDGSVTIVNTNTQTLDIPVAKQWVGPPAESATIHLLADGARIAEIMLSAENGWQHTFAGLPKFDFTDGHEIVYDVREDPMEGYEPGRSGSVETGFTFTNTISGQVSIPVTKRWVGPAADSVTVVLLADRVEIDETVLSGENNWQHTFTDLPKYKDGVEIQYEIREPELEGYAAAMTVEEDGSVTIVNTNTQTLDIPVAKQWVGPPAESATIHLLADGARIAEIVLNAENGWQHTFAGLPKFDFTDGHEIAYDVREDPMEGYEPGRSGSAETGFLITNVNTATRTISVEKHWIGTPLSAVTIRLLSDGRETASAALSESTAWKCVFAGLPRFDPDDGHEIAYTVTEDATTGYSAAITGNMDAGFVVTNSKNPSTPSNVPKTGDGSHLPLYYLTLLLSGGGLVYLCMPAKKRKRRP